tara:strand:+ start:295 stop:402 length:108 start_codon:yes stop_codon:yes gene_type:complete
MRNRLAEKAEVSELGRNCSYLQYTYTGDKAEKKIV